MLQDALGTPQHRKRRFLTVVTGMRSNVCSYKWQTPDLKHRIQAFSTEKMEKKKIGKYGKLLT